MDLITLALARGQIENLKKSGGIGYTERKDVLIVPESRVDYSSDVGGYPVVIPTSGTTGVYTVYIDGNVYELSRQKEWYMNAVNPDSPSFYYDGEFFHSYDSSSESIIVSVFENQQLIHPINEKYLPTKEHINLEMPIDFDVFFSGTPFPIDAASGETIRYAAQTVQSVYLFLVSVSVTVIRCEVAQIQSDRATFAGVVAGDTAGIAVIEYDASAETITATVKTI